MSLTTEQLANLPVMPENTTALPGKDTVLYIALDSTPTWLLLGGQRNSPISRKADSIDGTHKASGDYAEKLPGMLSWSISYDGLYVANDDAVAVLDDRFKNRKPVFVREEYPDGSYRTGWASVTQMDEDHSYNGVSTLKTTLEGRGAISDIQTIATPTLGKASGTATKGSTTAVTTTITPAEANIRCITTNTGTVLRPITDYTYSAGTLTLLSSFVSALAVGTTTLSIQVTADVTLTFTITVSAS